MYFNDLFEEMRHAKERELKCTKERIDRLRYCASELKTMFGIDFVLEVIDTPTWNVKEIPDYIVTVKDHEIFEKQPQREESGIVMVDENRENEEKSKRNSDFYERALEKMIDGVLESK